MWRWRCELTTFDYFHPGIISVIVDASQLTSKIRRMNFFYHTTSNKNISKTLEIIYTHFCYYSWCRWVNWWLVAGKKVSRQRKMLLRSNSQFRIKNWCPSSWVVGRKEIEKLLEFSMNMRRDRVWRAPEHTVYTVSNRINTTNLKMIIAIATKCKLSQG